LNGKTRYVESITPQSDIHHIECGSSFIRHSDTNSNFFAKQCFDLGIELKRIEVIADDEDEIVEAARRMTKNYDFVVCSGGIGPTHVSPISKANLMGYELIRGIV
jgi:hypothetical protein